MARVFEFCIDDRSSAVVEQAKDCPVSSEGRRCANGEMETNEKGEYPSRIATIDEIELSISRDSRVDHSGDHGREKPDGGDDGHGREQEFVVHVARIMWRRRNEHRDGVVDRVARGFKRTM